MTRCRGACYTAAPPVLPGRSWKSHRLPAPPFDVPPDARPDSRRSAPSTDPAPSPHGERAGRLEDDVLREPVRRFPAWLTGTIKVAVSAGLLWLLLARVDTARLWSGARRASPSWLFVALLCYALMVGLSAWRWHLLLRAQLVVIGTSELLRSFLVATFFNNFLPSNIGGDIVRITDTAKAAGSKTLATTVILIDRGLGLLALVFIAAVGATASRRLAGPLKVHVLWLAVGFGLAATLLAVLRPAAFTSLFSPLRLLHRRWVDERLTRIAAALHRFRDDPAALAGGALGAVAVQLILVAFYAAIAYSIGVSVSAWHLAVIVPVSFLVQMLPISLNGFGVREATFVFYFTRLGLPLESALLVSFMGAALIMLFSLSGAVVYATRR